MNSLTFSFKKRPAPASGWNVPSFTGNRYERGTALIMSLVILMILTILGITAMSTSSLEEKMSGNIQESTRAFEAAESGINSAIGTAGLLVDNAPVTLTYDYASKKSGSATVVAAFRENTPPSGRSQNLVDIYG